MRSLWVIEVSFETADKFGPWLPTVGVALSRDLGRAELSLWKHIDCPDRYRLVRYVPANPEVVQRSLRPSGKAACAAEEE